MASAKLRLPVMPEPLKVMWRPSDLRHPACPRCPDVLGVPIALRISAGPDIVTYECPACGREWNVELGSFDSWQ